MIPISPDDLLLIIGKLYVQILILQGEVENLKAALLQMQGNGNKKPEKE